jgi:hypothetical protein
MTEPHVRLGYQDWGDGLAICYAHRILPDGSVLEEPESCHALVKDLAPVTPEPRTEVRPVGASYPP